MLKTTNADFTIVGLNTPVPKFFWKGKQLLDITGIAARADDGLSQIKLRARNTTTFDADYAEMALAGIITKKEKAN